MDLKGASGKTMIKLLVVYIFLLSQCLAFDFLKRCNKCSKACPSHQVFSNSEKGSSSTCANPSKSCQDSKYRTIDGSCNNLKHTEWGMSETPYWRLVQNNYGDGISSLPISSTGKPLVSARQIRLSVFTNKEINDQKYTLLTMQWGQLIAHDMSLAAPPPSSEVPVCCTSNGMYTDEASTNAQCAAIGVPVNDPVRGPLGIKCLEFDRTKTTKHNNCTAPKVPADPISSTTSFMDLSFVYGNNEDQASPLRAWCGGRLLHVIRKGQEWLPQDPEANITCDMKNRTNSPCYLAGDSRVNQNPQLSILQVVLLREHNRIADILSSLNPLWTDEIVFQETRRILIAMFQHISYYEYLPILLGAENMVKHKLIYPDEQKYVNDYDPNINPSIINEHATAANRFFHSSVYGHLEKYLKNRKEAGSIRLSDWLDDPSVIEMNNNFLELSLGLTIEHQRANDRYYDVELTEYFERGSSELGTDLRAIDIQRSRDHGLGTYVNTRAVLGLDVPKAFDDLVGLIPDDLIEKLSELYPSIDDVELSVAGSLEIQEKNTQVGPTFLGILLKQFYNTRVGDRYFYENGENEKIAFTLEQLQSIRLGSSVARLFCDNVKGIQKMQPNPFEKISEKNKLVPCEEIPTIDLNLWKEKPKSLLKIWLSFLSSII